MSMIYVRISLLVIGNALFILSFFMRKGSSERIAICFMALAVLVTSLLIT